LFFFSFAIFGEKFSTCGVAWCPIDLQTNKRSYLPTHACKKVMDRLINERSIAETSVDDPSLCMSVPAACAWRYVDVDAADPGDGSSSGWPCLSPCGPHRDSSLSLSLMSYSSLETFWARRTKTLLGVVAICRRRWEFNFGDQSVLKRHYLKHLRNKIEEWIGLRFDNQFIDPRPRDNNKFIKNLHNEHLLVLSISTSFSFFLI
jgi:hypothetical protein